MPEPARHESRFPDVAGRRLIFSINPGRSGSKYLAELLGTAARVKSFHEAEPKMSGQFVAMINAEPYEVSRAARQIKADAIGQWLRAAAPEEIYAETNHTFITTFFDVVLQDFHNVDVIVLRRDPVLVLKSFIELGYFSTLNPLSLEWMASPNAATAALPAVAPDAALDQFDFCIAYLLDIEARTERFQRDYPQVRAQAIRLEQLNDLSGVTELFRRLGLKTTPATREKCGQIMNERPRRKERADNPTTVEECRRRLQRYGQKLARRGIAIPAAVAERIQP